MVSPSFFWDHLKLRGFTFFSGVPCSILTQVLQAALDDPAVTYIPAARENNALGTASGAYLAGRKSGILIQNSGLGNIINALTSFNLIYKIPVLMFITWRGYQGMDAPEHRLMGEKTLPILDALGVPYIVLTENLPKDIDWAINEIEIRSVPAAIIIKNGLFNEPV